MHVHINHMFCTDSLWGGMYTCRFMVSIQQYFPGPRSDGFKGDEPTADWKNLIDEIPRETRKLFESMHTNRLKPEVFNWLQENVKDRALPSYQGDESEKGFGIGTDDYNSHGSMDFNIFFYRRSDAFKFIKQWSVYKKPTTYFDYFKMISRQYNFKTKTLQTVKKLDY